MLGIFSILIPSSGFYSIRSKSLFMCAYFQRN